MRRIRLPWLALAATLALVACQTNTDVNDMTLTVEPAGKAELLAIARPWKGTYDWVVTYMEMDDDGPGEGKSDFGGLCTTPSDYLVRGTGRGQFSHMGRIAYTTEHCGRYSDGSWEGAMTFTAADGSTLVATYSGASTMDDEAEASIVANDFVITGGTGRFDGASGGGPGGAHLAWADEVALFTGQFTLPMWIDGSIVYAPGKAKGR